MRWPNDENFIHSFPGTVRRDSIFDRVSTTRSRARSTSDLPKRREINPARPPVVYWTWCPGGEGEDCREYYWNARRKRRITYTFRQARMKQLRTLPINRSLLITDGNDVSQRAVEFNNRPLRAMADRRDDGFCFVPRNVRPTFWFAKVFFPLSLSTSPCLPAGRISPAGGIIYSTFSIVSLRKNPSNVCVNREPEKWFGRLRSKST